jgi:hypothetical protein
MQVVHEVCCCGLDVHKKSVTACVLRAVARSLNRTVATTLDKSVLFS